MTFYSHLEPGNRLLTSMTSCRKSLQNFLQTSSRIQRGTKLSFMSIFMAMVALPLPTERGSYLMQRYL